MKLMRAIQESVVVRTNGEWISRFQHWREVKYFCCVDWSTQSWFQYQNGGKPFIFLNSSFMHFVIRVSMFLLLSTQISCLQFLICDFAFWVLIEEILGLLYARMLKMILKTVTLLVSHNWNDIRLVLLMLGRKILGLIHINCD